MVVHIETWNLSKEIIWAGHSMIISCKFNIVAFVWSYHSNSNIADTQVLYISEEGYIQNICDFHANQQILIAESATTQLKPKPNHQTGRFGSV